MGGANRKKHADRDARMERWEHGSLETWKQRGMSHGSKEMEERTMNVLRPKRARSSFFLSS